MLDAGGQVALTAGVLAVTVASLAITALVALAAAVTLISLAATITLIAATAVTVAVAAPDELLRGVGVAGAGAAIEALHLAGDQGLDQPLDLVAGDRPVIGEALEGQREGRAFLARQTHLGRFRGQPQLLHRLVVPRQVRAVAIELGVVPGLDVLEQPQHKHAVEIVAAQVRVAVGGQDLEDPVLDPNLPAAKYGAEPIVFDFLRWLGEDKVAFASGSDVATRSDTITTVITQVLAPLVKGGGRSTNSDVAQPGDSGVQVVTLNTLGDGPQPTDAGGRVKGAIHLQLAPAGRILIQQPPAVDFTIPN